MALAQTRRGGERGADRKARSGRPRPARRLDPWTMTPDRPAAGSNPAGASGRAPDASRPEAVPLPRHEERLTAKRHDAPRPRLAGLAGSLVLHGAVLALVALVASRAPDELERGGEIAVPVEFVLVGPAEQAAEEQGAAPASAVPQQAGPEPPTATAMPAPEPVLPPEPVPIPEPIAPRPPTAEAVAEETAVPQPVVQPPLPQEPLSQEPLAPQPVPPQPVTPLPAQRVEAPAIAAQPPPSPPQSPRARATPPSRAAARPAPGRDTRKPPSSTSTGAIGDGNAARDRRQTALGSTGGTASTAGQAEVASHRSRVLAHLQRFKLYPREAQERDIEGRVTVAFTLTANGQVVTVSLAGSSGSAILDQATLAMVRRAAPFPAAPAGAGPASFSAIIRYDLR